METIHVTLPDGSVKDVPKGTRRMTWRAGFLALLVGTVLVPYHGSMHDQGALRLARRLAAYAGADVTILRIVSPGTVRPDDGPVAEAVRAGAGKLGLRVIERRDAGRAVVEESARGYDLLLIGVGPEWGLEHRSFGLHSEQIITECPTSLLVVRQYEPALAAEPASVTRRRDAISIGA